MKYIRTECGMILIECETIETDDRKTIVCKVGYIEESYTGGLSYYTDISKTRIGKSIEIKSQGDNLIDVLEEKDLVMHHHHNDYQIISSIEVDKDKIWLFNSGCIPRDSIKKVITHEQYLPLAQEVK
jgi:hypothetical protein